MAITVVIESGEIVNVRQVSCAKNNVPTLGTGDWGLETPNKVEPALDGHTELLCAETSGRRIDKTGRRHFHEFLFRPSGATMVGWLAEGDLATYVPPLLVPTPSPCEESELHLQPLVIQRCPHTRIIRGNHSSL